MKAPPPNDHLTPDSLVDPGADDDESAWPVYSEPLDEPNDA